MVTAIPAPAPIAAPATFAAAALHGSWGDVPAAWLTGMTVGLLGIGVGSITSVLGPSSRVSSGGRPGAASKIAYVLGLVAMFVVMVAVSMIVLLFGIGVGILPVAAVVFVVATVIAVVLVRAAGSILARDPYRVNEALNG